MIALLGLLATLTMQQDTIGLSPRARAMLDRFAPPTSGEVAVSIRFSESNVWVGEQVELVTAAWFPRDLRERLRRTPALRAPALRGLWSAPNTSGPMHAETRRINGRVYDLFIAHQILFPIEAGPIEAPPALLTYAVPTSASFFAPEERRSLESNRARLLVRPIPAALAGPLGNGPTASGLTLRWRIPMGGLSAGTPAVVELAISGTGNVTLWPAPEIDWGNRLRIYDEPTEESINRPAGMIAGEKRFRYTIVVDSAGVIQLPRVRYPHFDPITEQVRIASAAAVGLAVRPLGAPPDRDLTPVTSDMSTPWSVSLVGQGWPLLILLAASPLVPFVLSRRRGRAAVRPAPAQSDPETELRRLLGQPEDATPGRVALALRRRGIARDEAAAVQRWLHQADRNRWGGRREQLPRSNELQRVLERLRAVAHLLIAVTLLGSLQLNAQTDEAIRRYRDGDAPGAERLFTQVASANISSPGAWLNLGSARWSAGDDVGAAAAWYRGLLLAPRDPLLRRSWGAVTGMPNRIDSLPPTVPLNQAELLLLTLCLWLLACLAAWRRRSTAFSSLLVATVVVGGFGIWRWARDRDPGALVRAGAVLLTSPVPGTAPLGEVAGWTQARLERRSGAWWLVTLSDGRRGWLPDESVAPLGSLD